MKRQLDQAYINQVGASSRCEAGDFLALVHHRPKGNPSKSRLAEFTAPVD
jgi:hypothetical protein